ncbi:low-specificity L-threonine aldolase [Robertmurraya korlensis]|uniref:low-specificity L-threonine aldolase n=1 Tax=Robertmurraya korlensis TaxID=519977 RepID=UPI00203DAA2A|nr:low-specificity L-threonine aldolase [Robertmurraya korlensis]
MIDLRSDTVTKPTKEMREAAFNAEVGDDVYGEDPAVNKLEEEAAAVLGKEAALFVTSGTQGNQIAVLTHCRPGQELLLEAESHIFYYESGAVSALAGVQTRTIQGSRGAMDPQFVRSAIRPEDIHFPDTGLICLENTHNRAGGAVVPIENMKQIYEIGAENHIPVHVDGARLFNAAAALDVSVTDFTQYCDTVQVCLSKGLGAPVGSLLAGDKEFIVKARKWRKRLGGGLRQAGLIAAPAYVALTTMRERLFEDHHLARYFADALKNINGIQVVNEVETNIVVVDVANLQMGSQAFVNELEKQGVLAVTFGPTSVRFTTHHQVNKGDIERTIDFVAKISAVPSK